MSAVARKTVVAGGRVYAAGATVPDDVAEGITAPGVLKDSASIAVSVDLTDVEGLKARIAELTAAVAEPSFEDLVIAAANHGYQLTPIENQVEGEGESEKESEDGEDPPAPAVDYGAWTVDQLKEEISTRNSYREPDAKLSTEGKKADLVAILTADDKA